MNRIVRRRLDRVCAFSQQHLTEVKGYTEAVTQLGEQLSRVRELTMQSEAGDLAEDAFTAQKTVLRRVIEKDQLEHIVRIAHSVTPSDPELKKRFKLVGEGLPETFVEELNAALDGFEKAVNEKTTGRASHVGARAELKALTREMGLLVRRLDSINRYRFRNDHELLAA